MFPKKIDINTLYSPAYSSLDQIESPISQSKVIHANFIENSKDPEENIHMPLVLLPKTSFKTVWDNLASDILRSIHSEYSFAKKSELDFKSKKQNMNTVSQVLKEKMATETFSFKSNL